MEKLVWLDDARVLKEESVTFLEDTLTVTWLGAEWNLVVDTVDQARSLADARLELVLVEGVVLAGEGGAGEASRDTDAIIGAHGALVGLGVLGIDAHVGDVFDDASVATNGQVITDKLGSNATRFGLTKVTRSVLCRPRQLSNVGKGTPLGVVAHNWDVDACDQSKDDHKGVNQTEVGHNTVSETANGIFTIIESEIEFRLFLFLDSKLFIAILETVSSSKSLSLTGRGLSAAATTHATPHSNDGVEEWQAKLDLEVVKRVHLLEHLLGVFNLLSFHDSDRLLNYY